MKKKKKKRYFNVVDVKSKAITTALSAKLSHSHAVFEDKGWEKCGLRGPPTSSPPFRSSLGGRYEWGCWKKVPCGFTSG